MGERWPTDRRSREGDDASRPDEIVQVNVEDDMKIDGGGHVVKDFEVVEEEQKPSSSVRRTALIIAIILGILVLLVPLIMSAAWLARILVSVGIVSWIWIIVVAVIMLFGILTAYYMARRNV